MGRVELTEVNLTNEDETTRTHEINCPNNTTNPEVFLTWYKLACDKCCTSTAKQKRFPRTCFTLNDIHVPIQ